MTAVWLSAGPDCRALCLPELIGGMAGEVDDPGQPVHVQIVALLRPLGLSTDEPEGSQTEVVSLEGRPTGGTYRGLPWWEVRRADKHAHCQTCGAWVGDRHGSLTCLAQPNHAWRS